MGSIGIIVIYVVALGLMMYFLAIKPQKKQQKAQQQQFLHLPNTRFRPHRKNLFSPLTDSRDGDGCGGGYSARHRPE